MFKTLKHNKICVSSVQAKLDRNKLVIENTYTLEGVTMMTFIQ